MIDQKDLKALIKLMVDNDLTEMDLEDEHEKIKLKRGGPATSGQGVAGPVHVVASNGIAPPATAPAAPAAPPAGGTPAAPTPEAGPANPTIDSPMVGTFYASPSPDAEAYVKVGDRVEADTVVCLVEAMKVFNEIKAEATGTVVKVLVESGAAVEFGQPLFEIETA